MHDEERSSLSLRRVHIWCGPYGEIIFDAPSFSDKDAERAIREKLGSAALEEAYGWSYAPERELKPEFDEAVDPADYFVGKRWDLATTDPHEYVKVSRGDDD